MSTMTSCKQSPLACSSLLKRARPYFRLEVPFQAGLYGNSPRWSNRDLDPVPVELQTWGGLDYWSYWCSYLLASPLTATISAVMSLGFTAREAIPIIFCGFLICSFVVTLIGRIGAIYHITYPVLVRAPFGMIGAYPAIVVRALVAIMWTSLLCVQGSGFLHSCITALWPSFEQFPNHLPASAGIDSAGLLCFSLWWIIQTALCLMPIQKLRLLFLSKAVIVPPVFFALFLWAVITTRGGGVLVTGHVQLTTDMGAVYSALTGINIICGLFSTMAINMPAFGRFSKNRMSGWHQYLALPVIGTFGALTPIFLCSAHEMKYGKFEWAMPIIVSKFESRPVKFATGLTFMLATIGNQIAAGSSPFSNDISGMIPRYMNVFRGTLIVAVLCFVLTPWKIVHNASGFLTFLGAYSCVMGPLAGVLMSDYYLIRHGRLDVHALYREGDIYWYSYGINWRAFAALLLGLVPLMPGLAHSIAPTRVNIGGAWKVYTFSWAFGLVVSAASYWVICEYVSPPRESLVKVAVLPPHVSDERELDLEMVTATPSETK